MTPKRKQINRRKFIVDAGCAAIGCTTFFSTLINMKAIAAAAVDKMARPAESGDYRALVCVLLAGGADSHNILIPHGEAEYNEYLVTRSNLAIPRTEIRSLNHTGQGGRTYGLHPGMPEIQSLFNEGKAAFIANVGTLIEPTTKAQYESGMHAVPTGLFSHADQIMHWQTGRPGERYSPGWGGRIADLVQSMNANQNMSMNISLNGRNLFQNGQQTVDFSIRSSGNIGINGYENTGTYHAIRNAAIDNMLDQEYQDVFEQTYVNTLKNSKEASTLFNEAINNLPEFATQFSDNSLSERFKMIAKVMAVREQLGFSRQTFFVNYGGWDHHDGVLEQQAEKLPILSAALGEFQQVLEELGISNNVTTFSISDFSRTLTSNGNGSDHAWGGNAMVIGGSVNGGQIYGDYPSLDLDNPLMLRRGRIIPTTSAQEYIAEMALWFGVTPGDINDILPDLPNFFDTSDGGYPLGFLNPIV
jgi:uncharacterized protein (DUF1501 family)